MQLDVHLQLFQQGIYTPENEKANAPRVPASKTGLIIALLVAIKNSYCYTVSGSTSKAKTGIALCSVLRPPPKLFTGASDNKFAFIVRCLPQHRLYFRTIFQYKKEFSGTTVATANSYIE
jgi:hypothetical protein